MVVREERRQLEMKGEGTSTTETTTKQPATVSSPQGASDSMEVAKEDVVLSTGESGTINPEIQTDDDSKTVEACLIESNSVLSSGPVTESHDTDEKEEEGVTSAAEDAGVLEP